jgi:hypothetical protein
VKRLRLRQVARETGQLDITRFFVVCGDKGTSPEGSRNGLQSEMTSLWAT